MKTARYLRTGIGVLAVALLGTAQAKKTDDSAGFAAFEGTYKGIPSTISYTGVVFQTTVNFTVKVPKSGKSAVITVSGFATYSGQTFPVNNTITLSKGSMVMGDVLFNLISSPGPAAGSISLNGKKTALSYTLVYAPEPTVAIGGTIRVQPQGKKKKKLTLTMVLAAGSTVYNYSLAGVAKVKPEKD